MLPPCILIVALAVKVLQFSFCDAQTFGTIGLLLYNNSSQVSLWKWREYIGGKMGRSDSGWTTPATCERTEFRYKCGTGCGVFVRPETSRRRVTSKGAFMKEVNLISLVTPSLLARSLYS